MSDEKIQDLPAKNDDAENVKGGSMSRFPRQRPESPNQPTSRLPTEIPSAPTSTGS